MLYHALPDEVDTRHLLSKWAGSKQLYLPIVDGDDLIVAPYAGGAMKQGAFHIWGTGRDNGYRPGPPRMDCSSRG